MAEVGTQAGQWVVVNPVYTATRIEQLKALHDAFAFWHTGTEVDANGVPKTVSGIHFYNDGSGHIFTGFMSDNGQDSPSAQPYKWVLHFDNDTPIEIYWDDLGRYIANYCGLPIEPVPQPSEAYTRTLRMVNRWLENDYGKVENFHTEFRDDFGLHAEYEDIANRSRILYWTNDTKSTFFQVLMQYVEIALATFRQPKENEAYLRYKAMVTNYYSYFNLSKAQAFDTEFKQFITHPKFSIWRMKLVGQYWSTNEGIELFANNSDLVRQMLAEFRAVSISTTARIPEAQVQELVEEIYERFTKTSDTFSEAMTRVLSRAAIEVEL